MSDTKDYAKLLQEPFAPGDVEWRVGSSGNTGGKPWAKVLAYITNRAIQNRLDEVFGVFGWKNEFHPWKVGNKEGILCRLSVQVPGTSEWVTKVDGAEGTDVEEIKGGLSDAMKRAAVQLGIGRYLYDLGENWAEIVDKDGRYSSKFKDEKWYKWNPPSLPQWARPTPAPCSDPKPIQQDNERVTLPKVIQAKPKAQPAARPVLPPGETYADEAAKGSVLEAAIKSTESVTVTKPAKSLAEEKREADQMARVNKAISRCALAGTKAELEPIADFADKLVAEKAITPEQRDKINAAVSSAIRRIDGQASSPHNPENK